MSRQRVREGACARALVLVVIAAAAMSGCGDRESAGADRPAGHATETRTGAISAADTSDTGRAAYYAAEVAKYRAIAKHDRELSAAHARVSLPETATKDLNAALKTRADARAAAADQIAAAVQTFADFHAARAAKAVGP